MVSYGQASHKDIWEMLDQCAPGWKKQETEHHYRIMWKDGTYPSLPKGEHGKKHGHALVEVGHIRHMIRQLKIDLTCARKHLPILK